MAEILRDVSPKPTGREETASVPVGQGGANPPRGTVPHASSDGEHQGVWLMRAPWGCTWAGGRQVQDWAAQSGSRNVGQLRHQPCSGSLAASGHCWRSSLHVHMDVAAWCLSCPGLLTVPPEAQREMCHMPWPCTLAVAMWSAGDVGQWVWCVGGLTLGGDPEGWHLCAGQ